MSHTVYNIFLNIFLNKYVINRLNFYILHSKNEASLLSLAVDCESTVNQLCMQGNTVHVRRAVIQNLISVISGDFAGWVCAPRFRNWKKAVNQSHLQGDLMNTSWQEVKCENSTWGRFLHRT